MSYDEFLSYLVSSLNSYKNLFYKRLKPNINYSYIVRLSKNQDFYITLFKRQHFVNFNFKDDNLVFDKMMEYVSDMLDVRLKEYKDVLDGSCDLVIFDFITLDSHQFKSVKIGNLPEVENVLRARTIKNIKNNFPLYNFDLVDNKGINIDVKYDKDHDNLIYEYFNNDL